MKNAIRLLTIAGIALLLAVTPPVLRADDGDGSFTGNIQLGFRAVDVGGHNEKYKEDINLDDGPRLFGLNFKFVPAEGSREMVDVVELNLANLGGDPFESFGLAVRKYGRFDFNYARTKSNYFYEDIILPTAQAGNPALALAGDFHHFDFDRVRDTADMKIRLSDRAKFTFGIERFTKKGESTTTLDISRDEFEFDKPVNESLDTYIGNYEYSWDKVTLALGIEERDYENVIDIFLPGFSLGEDPADATTLDFFFFDTPYDFNSRDQTIRVMARPTDKVVVKFSGLFQDLSLNIHADEESQGTSFAGAPFTVSAEGSGKVLRDLSLFDLDVSFQLNERAALQIGARRYGLDQQGDLEFDDEPFAGDWDIETTSYEAGVQFAVSSEVAVSLGVRQEDREVELAWSEPGASKTETEDTDQTGFFATLGWTPEGDFSLTATYEDSSYDNPFALTSPSDRQRLRVRGKYGKGEGFWASGSYLMNEVENSTSGWNSSYDQYDARLGYRTSDGSASVGFGNIDINRTIDQTVFSLPGFGGFGMLSFPIAYLADADFMDARFRWKTGEKVVIGGNFRTYDNDGSFGIDRDDFGGWVELDLGMGYLLHLGYRSIDYQEDGQDFDDYSADIAEVSLGYRW